MVYRVALCRSRVGFFATDEPVADELVVTAVEVSSQADVVGLLKRTRDLAYQYNLRERTLLADQVAPGTVPDCERG